MYTNKALDFKIGKELLQINKEKNTILHKNPQKTWRGISKNGQLKEQ